MKWIILRGLVREQRHWGDFRTTFEKGLRAFDPDAEVHALDFPGFGTEVSRFSPSSISGIVDDLRSRWLKISNGSPEWNLLAISLGGMVAMDWCARYPKDFKKLVLINSSIRGLSPLYKRMKPVNYPKIFSLLLSANIADRETKVLKMTSNLKGELLVERANRHSSFALPVRKRDAIAQIVAAIRFQPPNRIPVPTLVLVSDADQLVDPSCSEEIAKFYKTEIFHHPTANHDMPTDDPEWIVDKVKNWLRA